MNTDTQIPQKTKFWTQFRRDMKHEGVALPPLKKCVEDEKDEFSRTIISGVGLTARSSKYLENFTIELYINNGKDEMKNKLLNLKQFKEDIYAEIIDDKNIEYEWAWNDGTDETKRSKEALIKSGFCSL